MIRQILCTLPIYGRADTEELKQKIAEAEAAMRRALDEELYGDNPDRPRPRRLTMRQRLHLAKERVHDAWLVLTGRAEIG